MKLKDKFLKHPDKLQDLEIEIKVEIASKQIPLKDDVRWLIFFLLQNIQKEENPQSSKIENHPFLSAFSFQRLSPLKQIKHYALHSLYLPQKE